MIFRRFVAAFIIICLGLPSPSFGDTLRVTQEGVQQSGLEEKLQGRDEAQLFLDPVIRDGQIMGSPEPFRTYKNFPPTVWGEAEVQNAKQLALSGVRSFKAGNGGAAGFSFSGKTYKTALQHSPSVRFLVLVDPESREPTVAFDMATHQQVFPDPDLIDIFLDPQIQNGQVIGSPKVFAQYRNIREGFWSDPTVKRSKVVALSNVGTSRMSGGESAMGEGRASFFLIGRKYPTTLPVNPQLRLLVLVDPPTQLPTAAYDMATHQQVYPVPDLLEVFLNPQIRDGQLVGSPSSFRTYDRIPASFWNLQEVKSARQIAVSHFKTHQVGNALTAQISLAGRPYSITHPYHAQQQLLLVIDPAAKTPTAAFDMKTHEQVYPIPDQISVYLNPEIEEGRWKGDPGKPFATRARISAAFLNSSEVKKARSIALMPVPVFENKAGHIAAFSVAGENYNTTLKYDSAIRLLVLVDPETRKPTAAYDITTGQQAYPIPDPIEVFLDPDIQEGRIADPSRLFMTYQKQPKNLWSLKEVKSARRVAFSNVPTYKLTRARKVLFGLAGRKYVLPGATDPSMRLLVVADAQTKLPLSAYDMATGRQVYPALPADEQLRPLADMAAGGDQAWVAEDGAGDEQAGLEEGGMDVYLEPVIQGGRVAPDSQAYKTGVRKLTPYFWLDPKVQRATRVAVSGVPARNFEGKVSFSFGSRAYRTKREFHLEEQLRLLVVADRLTQIPQAAYHSLTGEEVWRLPEDQAASALQSLADLAASKHGWVPELEPSPVPARELEENEVAVYLNPQIQDGHIPEAEKPFRIFKRMTPVTFWLIPEVQLAGVVVMDMKVRDHQGSAAFSVGRKTYRTSRRFDPNHRFRMLVVVDSLSREVSAVYDRSTGEKIYPVQDSVEIYLDVPVVKGRLPADARPYVMAQLISDDFWKRREVGEAKTVIVAGLSTSTTYKTAEFFFLGAKYVTNRQFNPDKPLKLLLVVDASSRKPVIAYDMQTGEDVFPSEDSVKVYLNPQIEGGRLKVGQEPDRRIRAIRGTLWKDPDILQAKAVAFSPVNVVEKKSSDKRKTHVFSWGNSGITIEPRTDGSFSTGLLVIADPQMREPTVAYDLETGQVVYRFEDQIRAYRGSGTVPFWVGGRVPADLLKRSVVQGADSVVLENVSTFERNGMVYFSANRHSYATAQPYDREHSVRLRIVMDPETQRPLEAFDMETGKQLYATERIRVYLDPEIQDGRLQGSPVPFLEIGRPSSDFWSAEAVKKARSVVFENVPAGGTLGETAGFRLIGQGYPTRRKVDKASPLNLLVEADPQTHLPRRAYDQRTGEGVFSSDDLMAVYLAPEISEGRLPAAVSPVMLVSRITPVFWKRPGISEADTIALDHVTTYDKGGFLHFSMAGRTHPTSLPAEGRESPRLLVILDTKSKTVLAAYDRRSGQEVYSSQGMIQVYLDAPISEGKLSGKPVVYRTARVLMPGFWDESAVQGAQRIVLENVRTHADPQKRARFSVAGRPYLTGRRYDSNNPLRLLIDVDQATKAPIVAYDMNSGEAVYPIPAGPADQRLQPLVDMAAGGDQAWVAEDGAGDEQAGLEEMEVYLDPRIKDGRLEPGQSPYWTGNKLNRHFWDQKRVQQSQVVAIANRRTEKAHNSDSAVFSVRSVKYTLDRPFNAARPETLLVVMGLQPDSPVEAYLMDSGEKVYALGAEDLIRIYLDPPMEDGKLVGEPEPFLSGRSVPPSLWRDAKVVAAKEVVVDGVSTFNLSSGKAGFHSGPRGRNNATGREFDSSHPLKLRVVMDRASRLSLWAFDAVTGEQVYPAGEQISVYLDPVIEGGRLKSFSRLFFRAEIVRANVWQGLRKITTQPVALQGVPTYQRQMMAAFSIGGKKFETTRIFEQEHPLRLLVIVEPSTLIPSAAYDADTGERVYSSESLIGVHLNPEISDGKLVDPGKPSHRVAYLSAAFWDRAEVQAASTVALQDVEAISVAGGGSKPRYGFTLRNTKYRTERPLQAAVPLKLLVVANPRTQKPLAAYDQATGEKIYDVQKLVQVHLNPTVEAGRLVSPAPPYASTGVVQAGLWKELASEAPVVALSGIRGFHQRGVLTFHIGDVAYRTYFPLKKGSHADLLVIARTADKTPTEAYVLETGQKIYPPSESEISPALQPLADLAKSDQAWVAGEPGQGGLEEGIEVRLNPHMEGTKLLDRGEPFLSVQTISSVLWPQLAVMGAKRVAFVGIPAYKIKKGKTRFRFRVGRQNYSFSSNLPDTVKLLKLIAVASVGSQQVLAAFDQETREMVYPLMGQVSIYLDPLIEQGKLVGHPDPYSVVQKLPAKLWSDPLVLQAHVLALDNIPARIKGGIGTFKILGREYPFNGSSSDTPGLIRLLVIVNPKTGQVQAAHDRATGNLVYSETDLVKIYFDPMIQGGKLVPGQNSVAQMKQIQGLWGLPGADKAHTVVLEGAKAQQKRVTGNALFWLSEREYITDLRLKPKQEVPLLVVIDAKNQRPTVAYELETGRPVFDSGQRIQVYLNPVVREGRLVNAPEPYDQMAAVSPGFWDREPVRKSPVVALANVKTYAYSNVGGVAGFHLSGNFYRTNRFFDAEHLFNVLVLVDSATQFPTAAFDQTSGEQVYPAEEDIGIYLNPMLKDGRIPPEVQPYKTTGRIHPGFWNSAEIKSATLIGLAPVTARRRPEHNGPDVAIFALGNRNYPTGRSFDEANPLQLLLLVDPRTRSVRAAHDLKTGEQVYSDQQIIRVHVDPVVEGGKIVKPGTYVKEVMRVQAWHLFKEPKIRDAREWIAFEGLPAYFRSGNLSFQLFGKNFRTSRFSDDLKSSKLLVLVRPDSKLPAKAFDLNTGEQIYPIDPVDEQLRPLADMAAEGDQAWVDEGEDQTGLEEGTGTIKVYLNVEVAEGRIVGNPTPYRETKTRFGAKLLDDPAVAVSNSIVFTGIRERSEAGAAEFSVFGQAYRTNKRVDPAHPVSFLVVMDPRQGLVAEAFNEMTGERVYAWEDQLSIYLDPQMGKGLLVGNPSPFLVTSGVHAAHFRNAQVQKANRVVVDGVSTHNKDGTAVFLRGLGTGKRFDPGHPLRLRVVFDPKTQTPLIAYDRQTGEEVYRLEDEIHAYLEPVIEGGRLKRGSLPYANMSRVTPAFWNQAPVQKAQVVAFANFPASRVDSNGRAVFYLANQRYWANAVPAQKGPVHLLIVADPKARVPTAVYLQSTGTQVFPADDAMGVYLDPELKDGRIIGDPNPVNYVQIISTRTLGLSSVQRAQNVVFSNVAPHQSGTKAVFSVARTTYVTDLDYDPKTRLLVVVDPARQIPTAAYEAVSGKQVYPTTVALNIYLDAELSGGRLVGTPKPFLSAGNVRSSWWDLPEFSAAKQMIVENIPIFSRSGRLTFSLFGEDYPTARVGEGLKVEKVLVVVDLHTRLPVTAYSQVSGERVYPPDDLIRVYVDPEIQKGRLVGTPIPVKILQRGLQSSSWRSPVFQKASQVVFDNVPTSVQSDYVVFGMGGRDYFTRRSHVAGQSLRLLVVVDAATRQPIAAYDTATGEEVYSDEHLIRIFLDPPMEGGHLLLHDAVPILITKVARAKFWSRENVRNASRVVFENVSTTKTAGIGRKAIFYVAGHSYITNRSFDSEQPLRLIVVIDPKNRVPIAAYDKVTGEQVYPVQQTDKQLRPIADMAASSDGWVADEEGAGLEELAAEIATDWSEAGEGNGLLVISPDVLNGSAGPMIRRTVVRLPAEVANRVLLSSEGASAEDVAMTVLERDPLPDQVWVVGSFGPAFTGMLRGLTNVTELAPGSGLEEFLAQVGLMLGVPVNEIESGLEEIRTARPLERAA